MKISQFSNKYGVSNDTVRYYMELNLLTPVKKGGHYFYDERCESQIRDVLTLKDMGFSLQEIKNIFNFKRMGKLTTYQKNNYYQDIYQSKLEEINNQIAQLKDAKVRLIEKIEKLKTKNNDRNITLGINLSTLSIFACPDCNSDLLLSAKKVEANQVIDGSLNCECGQSIKIKDGIIFVENENKDNDENPDNDEEQVEVTHIENYIRDTDPEFIDKSYQTLEWLKRQFEQEDLSEKVILEPGSGYGHFLRQVYDQLPEDSIYICVDNQLQINKYLKQYLELTGKRSNVIFINADLPKLPLKDNLVDLMVDFTGTSCYCFENKGFLPQLLDNYLKPETIFTAIFIIYHKFGPHNYVERPYRHNFMINNVKNNLLEQNFVIKEEVKTETVEIKKMPGKYEDFANPGDKIYAYQIKAARD